MSFVLMGLIARAFRSRRAELVDGGEILALCAARALHPDSLFDAPLPLQRLIAIGEELGVDWTVLQAVYGIDVSARVDAWFAWVFTKLLPHTTLASLFTWRKRWTPRRWDILCLSLRHGKFGDPVLTKPENPSTLLFNVASSLRHAAHCEKIGEVREYVSAITNTVTWLRLHPLGTTLMRHNLEKSLTCPDAELTSQ